MDENLPPTNKAVLVLFEGLALAMAFGAEENWRAGHSAWTSALECVVSLVLSYIGFKWPWLKSALATRINSWRAGAPQIIELRAEMESMKTQHAKDLENRRLSLFEEIQAKFPSPEPSAPGPDLKVAYKQIGSERPRLVFKIRSGTPTTIRKVGPLVSEETYRTESDFILLQDVIPEVEVDHPVECQISCVKNATSGDMVSLPDALEDGGPSVSDSVLIEYTADNRQFSRRLFLYRNADGSIVWSAEDRHPVPGDLRILRRRLRSLRDAIDNLTHVGELKALEKESLSMESQLLAILTQKSTEGLDLFRPMKREIISLDTSETALPAWERLRLMSFRDRYNQFAEKCMEFSLNTVPTVPQLPFLPSDLTGPEFAEAISKHRKGINKIRTDLTQQYRFNFFSQEAH